MDFWSVTERQTSVCECVSIVSLILEATSREGSLRAETDQVAAVERKVAVDFWSVMERQAYCCEFVSVCVLV